MDVHGTPWTTTDIHGYPWISMDIHEYPWTIHGCPRILNVYPWIIHGLHGLSIDLMTDIVHLQYDAGLGMYQEDVCIYIYIYIYIYLNNDKY